MICTKCKIDKEENHYQKYWHSTQNKFRIRKECTECLYRIRNEKRRLKRKEAKLIQVSIKEEIIQPLQPELQPEILEDFSTNPNYKLCRTCQNWLDKSLFYNHKSRIKTSYKDCKNCINKKEIQKSKIQREKYLKETGGSERHRQNPNEWVDEYQKEATHNILKSMGWSFNEENGIWWKDGIKTKEGIFINVKNRKYRKNFIFDKYPKSIRDEKKKEMFDLIVKLRDEGKSYTQIGDKVGVSQTTVYKWLKNETI